MGQPSPIRLGGVELSYDPHAGLTLRDVHDPARRLLIDSPHLSALVEFIEAARQSTVSAADVESSAAQPEPSLPESHFAHRLTRDEPTQEQVIDNWLRQATAMQGEQRRQGRYPFFRPAMLTPGDNHTTAVTAFSLHISTDGIGLLHQVPLEPKTVQVSITIGRRQQIELEVLLNWCRSLAAGWYISGGAFAKLPPRTAFNLVWATVKSELGQRSNERQPFVRPVSIRTLGAEGETIPALCRDISPGGIGLFHSVPLRPQHVWLRLDPPLDISSRIKWSKPCGEGWYMSGAAFTKLVLEELPRLGP